ncbi:MAG TPA: S-adenosylmethionine:tRNA ribosyltransferase-isomerase [Solirubrobacteraceae bacterium]|jgi:S-adenosylmethionine:tRNA ribosyltransferase-isomerase|nr:S-adenosylmethionine:tRNA ribosyltransferase-isomerase [Solirubrobacteraceae bacterium]
MSAAPAFFELPERLESAEPPAPRDEVRLLAASPAGLRHAAFLDLPSLLEPGDLLVVNDSATLPAALPLPGGRRLHLSTPLPKWDGPWPADGFERWVVELREGASPYRGGRAGERLGLPGGGEGELLAPYLGGRRLWAARLRLPEPLLDYLAAHGEPIRYRHLPEPRLLADFQTIFAAEPGSAEMPSAGRPFSRRVLNALGARGVAVASLTLHTGVSSLERGEAPYPERIRMPPETAAAVNAARRVIAVGTTVVRALETVAHPDGTVAPFEGWTRLIVTPERGVRAVHGLLTGWHDPDASHLLMLEAIAGRDLVERSYATALDHGYRWHEFGDSHLLLP